jgi:hypothetical protein
MRFGGRLDAAVGAIAGPFTGARTVTLNTGGHDLFGLVGSWRRTAGPTHPGCGPGVAATRTDFVADYVVLLVVLRQALDAQPGDECLAVMPYPTSWSGTGTLHAAIIEGVL